MKTKVLMITSKNTQKYTFFHLGPKNYKNCYQTYQLINISFSSVSLINSINISKKISQAKQGLNV